MKNMFFLMSIIAASFVSFAAVNSLVSDKLVNAVAAKMVSQVAKKELSVELPEQVENLEIIDAGATDAVVSALDQ